MQAIHFSIIVSFYLIVFILTIYHNPIIHNFFFDFLGNTVRDIVGVCRFNKKWYDYFIHTHLLFY